MLYKKDLINLLDISGCDYFIKEHKALYTVEDSKALRGTISGAHSKNLFLKDAKGQFYLLSIEENASIDLKKTMKHIGSKKLSFAKTEYLHSILGIEPGSVSPFSLINDKNKKVIFYLDKKFLDSEKVNFHPLVNTATINISTLDMISFVEKHHNSVNLLDLKLLEQL
jgi:Ala-tRNA(Pro) deacylase